MIVRPRFIAYDAPELLSATVSCMFRPLLYAAPLSLLAVSQFAAAQAYFAGTVVDANNQPIAGATVQAGQMTGMITPFDVDGQAITDAQGHYAITTLAAGNGSGDYVLIAKAPGRVPIAYPNTPCYYLYTCPWPGFSGSVAVPNLAADFQLLHPASISGHVSRTDTSGPVAGTTVFLNGGAIYPPPTAISDMAGNFEFPGLLPDRYQLEIGWGQVPDQFVLLPQVYAGHDHDFLSTYPVGDDVILSDGQNATGIDFALNPGGTIQGTVFSAFSGHVVSAPIGIRRLTPVLSGGFASAGSSGRWAPSLVYSPPPGQYFIQPLLPGTFEIQFGGGQFSTEYYQHVSSEAQAQSVSVSGSQLVGGIDGVVAPYQTISGHITDKMTGNPVVNAIVHGGFSLPGFGELIDVADAQTDNSGAYTLEGLSPGQMYVWVTHNPIYLDQVYPDVLECCYQDIGTQPVPLAANQYVTGIDMALTAGASLNGHVYDADTGADAVNTTVVLSDASGRSVGGATTNSGGNFLTTTVPTGSYYVQAILKQGYYYYPSYLCPFLVTCDVNNAQPRTFSAPQLYSIDFPIAHLDLIFRGAFE